VRCTSHATGNAPTPLRKRSSISDFAGCRAATGNRPDGPSPSRIAAAHPRSGPPVCLLGENSGRRFGYRRVRSGKFERELPRPNFRIARSRPRTRESANHRTRTISLNRLHMRYGRSSSPRILRNGKPPACSPTAMTCKCESSGSFNACWLRKSASPHNSSLLAASKLCPEHSTQPAGKTLLSPRYKTTVPYGGFK